MEFEHSKDKIKELIQTALSSLSFHPVLGLNVHPVMCKKCHRVLPIGLPLGMRDIRYSCMKCKEVAGYGSHGDIPDCPKCKVKMTVAKIVEPEEPIDVDIMCDRCVEDHDMHTKRLAGQGIMVRCTACNSVGSLPSTAKRTKELLAKLKKAGIKIVDKQPVYLSIDPATQCPRCSKIVKHPAFSDEELKEVVIDASDFMDRKAQAQGTKKKEAKIGSDRGMGAAERFAFTAPGSRTAH